MKIKMLMTCLMILCMVASFSSCKQPTPAITDNESTIDLTDSANSSSDEATVDEATIGEATVGETTDNETMSDKGQTSIDHQPMGDNCVLIFDDYDDFLLFGSEGKLDSTEYTDTEFYLHYFKPCKEAFVDVKKIFNLNMSLKNCEERIVIEDRNGFIYYVSSRNEEGKSRTKFYITVKYDDSAIKYHDSVKKIETLSDMQNQNGAFLYRINDIDMCYGKNDTKYQSFSMAHDGLRIGIYFFKSKSIS